MSKRRKLVEDGAYAVDEIELHRRVYDEYNDPRFISLNMQTICEYLHTFDNDCDIATFGRIAMDCALSGGILFSRKGKTLSDASRDWHVTTWSNWVREVEKMYFCLGFAVASYRRHATYGGEPVVLNMESVEIKYFVDAYSVPHFRVYERLDMMESLMKDPGLYAPFGRRKMRNVKVWCQSAPYKDGRLRSQLVTLLTDLVYERHLLQTALVADAARARPPLVSQHRAEPHNIATVTNTNTNTGWTNVSQSRFPIHIPKPADADPYDQARNCNYRNASNVVAMMNAFDADSSQGIAARLDRMLSTRINNRSIEQLYIEDGRELVKQVLPEAPHQIILGFRTSRMVRVALMFGVTMPALTKTSSTASSSSEVRKPGGKGNDEDGSNSQLFEQHQRELRQRLTIYIRGMYLFIHSLPLFAAATAAKKKGGAGAGDSATTTDISVTLPGQPPDDVLKQMFFSGCLKYKSFIDYISTKHCIPLECFESKPGLTLQELNGIQEKEEPTFGKKKKK